MKTRNLLTALLLSSGLVSGAAMAHSHSKQEGKAVDTSPSATPNDTTGTPPNTAVPKDRVPPAPVNSTNSTNSSGSTMGTTAPNTTAPGQASPNSPTGNVGNTGNYPNTGGAK